MQEPMQSLAIQWQYCKVATHVTDWGGYNGPRGIVLRGPGARDFKSIDEALEQMGLLGWECFYIEKSPPPNISYQMVELYFKRPM